MVLYLLVWSLSSWLINNHPIQRGAPIELYPNEAVEALIAVESCGDPYARGGSMLGILQMSPIYMRDAGEPHYKALNPMEAVRIFDQTLLRYSVRRRDEPEMVIPIFHKGGPAVLKRWRRRTRRGEDPRKAAIQAARALGIKGMDNFLRKYKEARMGRAWWCGPKWKPYKLPSKRIDV